ncbi:MAG TPA: DGQHR domain-containing protein [Steroidobacteraceae bacterium]|nr:DGQHR domain-containing protein [Steroidobacteraceae bacterium]
MEDSGVRVPAVRVRQPIGEFYAGVMSHKDLIQISFADMRRIETELDRYVGIQRKLSPDRVTEIKQFVNGIDGTFPTSVVLAVPGSCARFDDEKMELVLFEGINDETGETIRFFEIAKILDGQHRIEGLKGFSGDFFDVPVSIFVEADIADQAYVFATVNLAQTKVNRSLVYDLLDYSKARSPQRSCHDITVALDRHSSSPFLHSIKRLGSATPGRTGETLAQATVVNALLPFISKNPLEDRQRLAKGKTIHRDDDSYLETPFRWLWITEQEDQIARILIEFFSGVAMRWPTAWKSREKGNMLPRTNGFRALIRLLKNFYLQRNPRPNETDPVITRDEVLALLEQVNLSDGDLSVIVFPPGSSGEKQFYERLREATKL